jgi:hypothetical protein
MLRAYTNSKIFQIQIKLDMKKYWHHLLSFYKVFVAQLKYMHPITQPARTKGIIFALQY